MRIERIKTATGAFRGADRRVQGAEPVSVEAGGNDDKGPGRSLELAGTPDGAGLPRLGRWRHSSAFIAQLAGQILAARRRNGIGTVPCDQGIGAYRNAMNTARPANPRPLARV